MFFCLCSTSKTAARSCACFKKMCCAEAPPLMITSKPADSSSSRIGTVSETIEAIQQTQAAGWNPVVSARSGETEDAFISHLAVATNAGQLKVGSFARSERMVKWNEVLRIEQQLGERAAFKGGSILH